MLFFLGLYCFLFNLNPSSLFVMSCQFYSLHLLLTDRGIIMTFGSGSNGCLGHGNYNDITQVSGSYKFLLSMLDPGARPLTLKY